MIAHTIRALQEPDRERFTYRSGNVEVTSQSSARVNMILIVMSVIGKSYSNNRFLLSEMILHKTEKLAFDPESII